LATNTVPSAHRVNVKIRRLVFASAIAAAVVYLLYVIVLPANPKISSPRLKLFRHASERGREVVFFRVELDDNRRVQICGAEKIAGDGDTLEELFLHDSFPMRVNQDFWAPSQVWPLGDFRRGRKEFGVLAPTNAPTWKLRIAVCMSVPRSSAWLTMMRKDWAAQRRSGASAFKAASDTWNTFYQMDTRQIESETITNPPPADHTPGPPQ
jgi:hypothetical protein